MRIDRRWFSRLAGRSAVSGRGATLTSGARRLLIGQHVDCVRRFEVDAEGRRASFVLLLEDGSVLTAPAGARLDGAIGELARILAGATTGRQRRRSLLGPRGQGRPRRMLDCANALLVGKRITGVPSVTVRPRDGQISFTIELEDSTLHVPLGARISGPFGRLCKMASSDPQAAHTSH
jgi:hypothetical protein